MKNIPSIFYFCLLKHQRTFHRLLVTIPFIEYSFIGWLQLSLLNNLLLAGCKENLKGFSFISRPHKVRAGIP